MNAVQRPSPWDTEEKYRQLRHGLIQYFAWNGASDPCELADETVFRIVQSSSGSEEIRNWSAFTHTVAQHVLSEYWRHQIRKPKDGNDVNKLPATELVQERLCQCLEKCRKQLTRGQRALIDSYYRGEKGEKIANRERLAKKFGVSPGGLRLRTLRIRQKLAACMEGCSAKHP